jgi:hypothetical protein
LPARNLLIVSIERKVDVTILKALQQAEAALGEIRHAVSSHPSPSTVVCHWPMFTSKCPVRALGNYHRPI